MVAGDIRAKFDPNEIETCWLKYSLLSMRKNFIEIHLRIKKKIVEEASSKVPNMNLQIITRYINDVVGSLPAGDKIEPRKKEALIAACDKLKASVENPLAFVFRLMMGVFFALFYLINLCTNIQQTHLHVAARIGVEMGSFNIMAGNPEGMDLEQLSFAVKADVTLVDEDIIIHFGVGSFR